MLKRWLIIDSATFFGGHEAMVLRLLEALGSEGRVEPWLLARAGTALRSHPTALPFLTSTSMPERGRRQKGITQLLKAPFRELSDARSILAAINEVEPDICIVAAGYLGYLPTILTARMSGRRTVVYVPLVDSYVSMGGWRRPVMKDLIVRYVMAKIPHAWITLTDHQAKTFTDWAHPTGPVFCLPNAISTVLEAEKLPTVRSPDRGPSSQRLRVLILGRLDSHQKGLDFLLAHLEAHPEELQKMQISIVGEGPYRATIDARVALLAQPGRIQVLPWSDTAQTMSANDVLFLPSRFEGVPLVMLEAMALGLPVVASDMPGTRDYLEPDCLFPVGDMLAAFASLHRLADDEMRAESILRNRQQFERTSSGAAFSAQVSRLVDALNPDVGQGFALGSTDSKPVATDECSRRI